MSFTCDQCGYKNNEIKAGGPIAEKGRRIALRVMKPEDMARDLLKVRFFKELFFPRTSFALVSAQRIKNSPKMARTLKCSMLL